MAATFGTKVTCPHCGRNGMLMFQPGRAPQRVRCPKCSQSFPTGLGAPALARQSDEEARRAAAEEAAAAEVEAKVRAKKAREPWYYRHREIDGRLIAGAATWFEILSWFLYGILAFATFWGMRRWSQNDYFDGMVVKGSLVLAIPLWVVIFIIKWMMRSVAASFLMDVDRARRDAEDRARREAESEAANPPATAPKMYS